MIIIESPVTPVPIGLEFDFRTALGLGLGLRGPDLGLGLDNKSFVSKGNMNFFEHFSMVYTVSVSINFSLTILILTSPTK